MAASSTSIRPAFSWAIFLASAFATVSFFFIPAFIIRPFRRQSAYALNIAMDLRQRAPWITLITAGLCLVFLVILWPAVGRLGKIVLGTVMALVVFSAVMSRLNYFEWMFHPVDSTQFQAEALSKLDKAEMILAIRFGDDARAYPISQMAYHHVLNDVVEGIPVAVTY